MAVFVFREQYILKFKVIYQMQDYSNSRLKNICKVEKHQTSVLRFARCIYYDTRIEVDVKQQWNYIRTMCITYQDYIKMDIKTIYIFISGLYI